MSLAKVSLGRLLASSAGLRFAWQLQHISVPLNDVLAENSLNDVVAFNNYDYEHEQEHEQQKGRIWPK